MAETFTCAYVLPCPQYVLLLIPTQATGPSRQPGWTVGCAFPHPGSLPRTIDKAVTYNGPPKPWSRTAVRNVHIDSIEIWRYSARFLRSRCTVLRNGRNSHVAYPGTLGVEHRSLSRRTTASPPIDAPDLDPSRCNLTEIKPQHVEDLRKMKSERERRSLGLMSGQAVMPCYASQGHPPIAPMLKA